MNIIYEGYNQLYNKPDFNNKWCNKCNKYTYQSTGGCIDCSFKTKTIIVNITEIKG